MIVTSKFYRIWSSSNGRLSLLLLLTFLIASFWQISRLKDLYAIDEDFRNLYWVHRLTDTTLFQDDPLIAHQLIEIEINERPFVISKYSPGYGFIFQSMGHFISPILLSKLLAFPLILITVYYFYHLIDDIAEPSIVFIATLFFVMWNFSSPSDLSIASGLQRSFAIPLWLGMAYALSKRKDMHAAILIFASVIYPPAFIINTIAYGLSLISEYKDKKWRFVIHWKRVPYLIIPAILALTLLLPAFLIQVEGIATINKVNEGLSVFSDPTFRKGGRYPLFILFPIIGDGGFVNAGLGGLQTALLIGGGAVIWWKIKPDYTKSPSVLWFLFIASLIGFTLAWSAILVTSSFSLHLPNRYTRVTLFLIPLIFIILNTQQVFNQTKNWLITIIKRAKRTMLYMISICIILGTVIFVMFIPTFQTVYHSPSEEQMSFHTFLKTLPVDIVIAGNPCSLNGVPIYAQRKILYSCETPNASDELMLNALTAYYAEDEQEVYDFCQHYAVDYFVVNMNSFSPKIFAQEQYTYEPLNSQLIPLLKNSHLFALENIPTERKVYESETLYVIPCGIIAK